MYHVVFLVTKKPGMTQEEFIRYWIDDHCPLTAMVPGLREYKCYPMVGQMDGPKPPFDAIAYIAFDDETACLAGLASDEFRNAVADGPNFQDTSATFGFFAREYTIVDGSDR